MAENIGSFSEVESDGQDGPPPSNLYVVALPLSCIAPALSLAYASRSAIDGPATFGAALRSIRRSHMGSRLRQNVPFEWPPFFLLRNLDNVINQREPGKRNRCFVMLEFISHVIV